ncbi:beta-xylosidase, partial [Streptomyces sp. ISL-66]|nr:beta-xylosidase [Streptomyces sp. ISL-66]
AGAEVNFGTIQLDGASHDVHGTLNPIEVSDARGGTAGWSLTGTLSDFTAAGGGTAVIPAGAVSWTPSCAAHSNAVGTPSAGAPGALGATPAGLCELASGGGQVVGGVFDASAGLNLHTPAVIPGGNYAATLTLSLS